VYTEAVSRCLCEQAEFCTRYVNPVLLWDLEPSVKHTVGWLNECMSSWRRLLMTDAGVHFLECWVSVRLIGGGAENAQGGVAEKIGDNA